MKQALVRQEIYREQEKSRLEWPDRTNTTLDLLESESLGMGTRNRVFQKLPGDSDMRLM